MNQELSVIKEEMQGMKQELFETKAELKEIKKLELNRQINESSRSVMINELEPINPEREKQNELKEQFDNVLNEIGIKDQVSIIIAILIKTEL